MIPKSHNPNMYGKRRKTNERQKEQTRLLNEMRDNFKPKPISQVKQMLLKHQLKLVRGKGIFQV